MWEYYINVRKLITNMTFLENLIKIIILQAFQLKFMDKNIKEKKLNSTLDLLSKKKFIISIKNQFNKENVNKSQ